MSIFSDIGNIVGKVAPWIGSVVGGPIGGMAGKILGDVFGMSAEDASDPEKLSQAMKNATPEQLLALKKADNDFKIQMQEIGFKQITDLENIAAGDRANARAREIAVKDHTPAVLAAVVTVGFFGVLAFALIGTVPEGSRDIVNIMIGTLGTAWVAIITYYFGSSSGSKGKDDTIKELSAIP